MPAKRKTASKAAKTLGNVIMPDPLVKVSPSLATAVPATQATVSSSSINAARNTSSGKTPKYIVGLVDVNSSAHRVFQQWYSLTTKMGMQINLDNYLRKQSTYVLNLALTAVPPALSGEFSGYQHRAIACFDAGCGGRELLMPEYKAHRPKERPEGLDKSFAAFRTAIRELGSSVLSLPPLAENAKMVGDSVCRMESSIATDAEADDMLATAAAICKQRGNPCVVITGDKDMLQLIDDQRMCVVYDTLKKQYFDEAGAQKRVGVLPKDMLAYKVLAGDASDGISGCEGIGETRAMKLVNKYRSLDKIIELGQNDKDFPEKVRAALKAFAPKVDVHTKVMGLQHRSELVKPITDFLDQ